MATGISNMYIDHIAIWTMDIETMKDFYVRYFNCSAGEKYVNPLKKFSSYFLTFESGSRIELMKRGGMTGSETVEKPGLAHIAVNVGSRSEVDRLTALFEKDGIRITGRPRITGDGYYESVILDPEGNVVEIVG